tara:strand:- start:1686 stop:1868 length:183 start_codon:yes stop_codon:yes gene_type:complete
MFKNKKTEFWFWFVLVLINSLVVMITMDNENNSSCIFSSCVLVLCLAKSLVCAMEIEREE